MADTQTIKDRVDIVELIKEYVPLKKAGANWKANCPFHHEKSPSFMAHQEKQIWHCFGCGKGGDIFTFIQEIEGLDFIDALKLLANRAGVKIDARKSELEQSQRNRLLEINEAAANFFHRFLTEMNVSAAARDYLQKRGLTAKTIADWQVGYVPDQWDLLTQYLLKRGFGIDDLVAAGLTIKRDGADAQSGRGFYDRFRGRIMFPIADAHGNVVGFTGRVLVETANSGGKYVNTPQTILFDKSRLLYGLHKAKMEIKNKDLAIIVEGQMDVIACSQAGMSNVVAASGTALTAEQVKLLKRYSANIAMAFDADSAGEKAGKRGIDIALAEGLNVKVIQIPANAGKDADECIKKDSAVWFSTVKSAKEVVDWYLERCAVAYNLTNPKQKQKAVVAVLTQISNIPFAVERDEWLKKVAGSLKVDIEILREELKKMLKKEKMAISANHNAQSITEAAGKPAPDSLATAFWSLLVKFPDLYPNFHERLHDSLFTELELISLYEEFKNLYNMLGNVAKEELREFFDTRDKINFIDVLDMRPYENFADLNVNQAGQEAEKIFVRLKDNWRKKRSQELKEEIAVAEADGNKKQAQLLLQELQLI